jgi:thymidylate synthase (FAD)
MKIIDAGYEILDTLNGEEILKKIERVARVCYKSEDKITEGSAEKMVRALVKSEHFAMLEHGEAILEVDHHTYEDLRWVLSELSERCGEAPMLRLTSLKLSRRDIVSGNMRAWLEFFTLCCNNSVGVNTVLFDVFSQMRYFPIFEAIQKRLEENEELSYTTGGEVRELFYRDLSYEEMLVHYDFTVKFICDRGVSHEIVRHRVASYAQESTRYCNYSKGNVGDVTFIRPCFFTENSVEMDNWVDSCMKAEQLYKDFILIGRTPQEARSILPNSLKTEVVMTANLREWRHFLSLRACGSTGKPHPQMLEVAVPLLKELRERVPVVFDDLEPMEWETVK